MVEQVFGFLPSMIGGQEGQAPWRFEVRWALLLRGLVWQGMGGPHSVSLEAPREAKARLG